MKKNGKNKIENPITEISNLDKERYQLLTQDDDIIKYLKKEGLEKGSYLCRKKKSAILANQLSTEYEKLYLYYIDLKRAEDIQKEFLNKPIKIKIIQEKRTRKSKKEKENANI
jgi:hypothetical protein